MQHARNGFAGSFARSNSTITFAAKFDLHYELSGRYSVSGAASAIDLMVQLSAPGTNEFYQPDPQANGAGTFSLGTGANGNLSGTLFQDFIYTFDYLFGISNSTQMNDAGASAMGSLKLHFSLRGDLNDDRSVGFDDLLVLAQHYGQSGVTYAQGDIDGDGKVAFEDLLILSQKYGESATAPAIAPVPEPSANMLFVMAALLANSFRFRRN